MPVGPGVVGAIDGAVPWVVGGPDGALAVDADGAGGVGEAAAWQPLARMATHVATTTRIERFIGTPLATPA